MYTDDSKVFVGDCIDVMQREEIRVDMCLTAPPYYTKEPLPKEQYLENRIGQEESVDKYIEKMVTVFSGVWSCLDDTGTLWLVLGDACKGIVGVAWMVAFALRDDGWLLIDDYVFDKIPTNLRTMGKKRHHTVFVFAKQADNTYENTSPCHVWSIKESNYRGIGHSMTEYPAMPSKLANNCISIGSKIGESVLDPFFGSGTTGKVCKTMGRSFVGIELNPGYGKIQNYRIHAQ